MTRPTDTEIAALLSRASWQVQGCGFQMSAGEREVMALQMRDLATRLTPITTHANGPTAPSERRHGAYTGD